MSLQFIKVKKVESGSVIIHCVQAPESGEIVNAQLIETPNKLLLIDTLQLKPHADELREYIESLNKPLERIIITHHHPDHWIGAASFEDYPIAAFPEVIGIINALADYLLGFHRSLHPDNPDVIPSKKVLPTEVLEEGPFDFDGVTVNLIKVFETECPVNLVVELPEHKILLAQDLVYNKAYPYFGERTQAGDYSFDNWIAVLKSFETKGYEHILPGHGDPTDPSIIQIMIGYLNFAKQKVTEGLRGDELISSIKNEYPDYGLELTLTMSNYMLFIFKPE
jgi:glyoxylase-like metal-dependent hydrolase (beta-lactamase superfamily II)